MENINLTDILVIPVVAACIVSGFIIKNYTKFPNNFIPLFMAVLGAVINSVIGFTENSTINITTVIYGAISGLAATGTYEGIVGGFGLKNKKTKNVDDEEVYLDEESSEENN